MSAATQERLIDLPGEDRSFANNPSAPLFVDLVPSSCWFTNVRYCVQPKDWDRLRRFIYARAGFRCEVCGAGGRIECHERWSYDERTLTQKLVRLIALCRSCHMVTHFGYACIRGVEDEAFAHLQAVNNWTFEQAQNHTDAATDQWRERSSVQWHLDLSLLEDAGIQIKRPVRRGDRARIADESLDRH